MRHGISMGIAIGALLLPVMGQAYDEAPVADGGRVSGRVVLTGTPPPARIFHLILSPNPDVCSRIADGRGNRLLPEFRVDPAGGLADTVVMIVGVERGKPFPETTALAIENCRMAPFVLPLRDRQPLPLVNRDTIAHDVQAYTLKADYTFAMFNRPLEPKEQRAETVRLRPGHTFFRAQCGVHAFMQAWGIAVGNPYFAVTGADGGFAIDGVPPGRYYLLAWHPLLEPTAREILIEPNGAVTADVAFAADAVRIPLHDLQTSYRFDTFVHPGDFPPPNELQR